MKITRLLAGLLVTLSLSAAENSLAAIRATGQYDADGTVLYSVFIATKTQLLSEISVASAMPAGTRFLESVDVPKTAVYDGVKDNVIVWRVSELGGDQLLGPFTFRLKLDGSNPTMPVSPTVSVSYQKPQPEVLLAPGDDTVLEKLSDAGSITFDTKGTVDSNGKNAPVAVGQTGILVFVPEGAVTERTTLTLQRQAVEDEKMPKNAEGTWWCARYAFTLSPAAATQKKISFAIPTRRGLTPGLDVRLFGRTETDDWREFGTLPSSAIRKEPRELGFGGSNCVTVPFQYVTCTNFATGGGFGFGGLGSTGGLTGGFGVSTVDRSVSTVNGQTLSVKTGQVTNAASTLITDGTSNIIAILIGLR